MAEADNDSGKSWEQGDIGKYLLGAGVKQLITGKNDDGSFVMTDINKFFEGSEAVGMYYSAHWCPPCRGFTPELAKKYKKDLEAAGLKIIFNSWDRTEEAFKSYYSSEMPWAAIPYEYKDALSKQKVFKQPQGIPSLYLFDKGGALYQTSGRGAVMDGRPFPYKNPSWDDMLDLVIDKAHEKVDKDKIKSTKYIGLYFSAHWCPPCRGFTPKLVSIYKKMVEKRKDFEFIFVSSDRDEDQFKSYFAEMPWLAFNKGDSSYAQVKSTLSDLCEVNGIPHLAIVSGSDGSIISKAARGDAANDPEGENFPWPPKAMYRFAEGKLDGINDNPSIVLMMEKGDVANKEETFQYMSKHANAQMALKEAREYFHFSSYEADNSVGPQIRKFTGIGDENVMICVDFQSEQFWKDALPKSEADVEKFVAKMKDGTLKPTKLSLR